MEPGLKLFLAAITLPFLVSSCGYLTDNLQPAPPTSGNGNASPILLSEIARATDMAARGNLKESDILKLKGMMKEDEKAAHEIDELKVMIKYGQWEHATHSLGFLDNHMRTGKEMLCPAHELAHYYFFMEHGEDGLAKHSLEEAKKQVDAWIPKAMEFHKKYPNGEDFDKIAATVKESIAKIEAGNYSISDSQLEYLDSEAGICVLE